MKTLYIIEVIRLQLYNLNIVLWQSVSHKIAVASLALHVENTSKEKMLKRELRITYPTRARIAAHPLRPMLKILQNKKCSSENSEQPTQHGRGLLRIPCAPC